MRYSLVSSLPIPRQHLLRGRLKRQYSRVVSRRILRAHLRRLVEVSCHQRVSPSAYLARFADR